MKKHFAALSALLLLLSACSGQPAAADDTAGTTLSPALTLDAPTSALEPLDPLTDWSVAETRTVLGTVGEVESYKLLRYPAFAADNTTAEKLNAALAAAAERAYAAHAANVQSIIDEGTQFVYTVTEVEVTRFDETLLSVLCHAEYTAAGRTERFIYTCNLNPATAAEYAADELVTDFTTLCTLLCEGKGEQRWGAEDLLTQTTWEDLLVQVKPAYGIYPPVCFDEEGIIIGFELNSLLGDHAGFALSYTDAAGCLAVGNPQ